MIYVTHDQVEAMTLGERIVVINGGRIEQVGTPSELYKQPGNLFVAGFLGAPKMNLIAGRVAHGAAGSLRICVGDGTVIETALDGSQASAGELVTLGIRAESMQQQPEHASATGNTITLEVGHVEYLGDQTIAYARLPQHPGLIAVRQAQGGAPLRTGSSIQVHLPPAQCHAFNLDGQAFLHPVTIQSGNRASI